MRKAVWSAAKTIMKKLTQKDFEFYKKCCLEYADEFELNNWTFRFHFKKEGGEDFEGGKITRNINNYQADIYLDPIYYQDKEGIKATAKHEMIHCLLGALYILGRWRFVSESEIDAAEEQLVHKLEKLL